MTRDQELQPGKEAASQVEREMEVVRSISALNGLPHGDRAQLQGNHW